MQSDHSAEDPTFAVLEKARRLGPVRYSSLGRIPAWRPTPEPEVAEWVAGWLDRCWYDAGQPDPYPVVDVGAGDGTLARQVLALGPVCMDALRYVLVEPDGLGLDGLEADWSTRALVHGRYLPIEAPSQLFPPAPDDPEDPDDVPLPAREIGPLVTSLAELPRLGGPAAVFAVGWTERLPIDLVEWQDNQWWEVRLAASGDHLDEILVPVGGDQSPFGWARSSPPPEDGTRFAVLVGAVEWLSEAVRAADSGRLAVCAHWDETTQHWDQGQPWEQGQPWDQATRRWVGGSRLALDQMSRVHHPLPGGPEPLPFAGSAVTWRLG